MFRGPATAHGSVWPHDNSIIVMGMKRYGYIQQAADVSRAVCDAASYFVSNRLPELFARVDRGEIGFPLRYVGANVPQAWATGAIFAIIQALIGFAPDAPRHRLELDPILPDWLVELEVRDLSVGKRRVDLRFWREDESTRFEVTKGDPTGIERGAMIKPADGAAGHRAA
jgi:glycogen debranching enzyme